jgi:uncharacterized membrane protein YqiK
MLASLGDAFASLGTPIVYLILAVLGVMLLCELLGMRFIPNSRMNGEAGFQVDLLRGGLHFGLWRWQYRIHKVSLVTVPQGKIGYVYARDGEPLTPSQTLARVANCNNFQDARAFLDESGTGGRGQRGRQRAILREGMYAINLALFVVITEDVVYRLDLRGQRDLEVLVTWQKEIRRLDGFRPVVIGAWSPAVIGSSDEETPEATESSPRKRKPKTDVLGVVEEAQSSDNIGIVTVQDGPSLQPGEIIAPSVGNEHNDADYHNNYQDTEAFLRAGGRRGRQYVTLTDGTYFINRWFATVEIVSKTVVPIGFVGVVVSYCGKAGHDLSGDGFRHGERVAEGDRGVWQRPLGPGKYPFNTYAGSSRCRPPTSCCTGLQAVPRRIAMTRACARSTW